MAMLEKEFKYYKDHQNKLVKKYNGKCLLIVGEKIVGEFERELDAYIEGKSKYGYGKFLIQNCGPGKNNYTKRFHARVSFNNPHHT